MYYNEEGVFMRGEKKIIEDGGWKIEDGE